MKGKKPEGLFDPRGKQNAARYAVKVAGCVECGRTALYRVGTRGYCKAHQEHAKRRVKILQYNGDYMARAHGTQWDAAIDGGED